MAPSHAAHPGPRLPSPPTTFVGREGVIAELRALLLDPGVRLLTLSGPGGVGKTRVAVEVAEALGAAFAGGVFFVPLSSIRDPGLVLAEVARALGVREPAGQQLDAHLREALRARQILLVLDNFEQVAVAATALPPLLAAAPALKILVTSRAVLHLYGEQEFTLSPLALPDPGELPPLERLAAFEAVQLFVARASAARRDFALTPANAADVAAICARLDGLPLAIELAAARIRILSPPALLARLDRRLQILTGGAHGGLVRHRALRDAIAWSYDLLPAEQQELFRRLAVFAGPWSAEAAAVVAGRVDSSPAEVGSAERMADDALPAVFDRLKSLLDSSLILAAAGADGEPRFAWLETIREYALEQLASSSEAAVVRERHALYYLALAEAAEPELLGRGQQGSLQRLEAEHDNLRAALAWAVASGAAEPGLRLGGALWRFWYVRSHFAEGRRWLAQVLAVPGADKPSAARGKALNGAGNLAYNQGDYEAAGRLHEQRLQLARSLDDRRGVAAALNNLGLIARARGDYPRAHRLLGEALALNREAGNRAWEAINLNNLGLTSYRQGDYALARSLQEQSLALFVELGDEWGMAMALSDLGRVVSSQGDYQAARALYEQSRGLQERLGDRRGLAGAMNELGRIAARQGDYDLARDLGRRSLAMFQELGDRRGIAAATTGIAGLALDVGDLRQAAALYREALTFWRQAGEQAGIAECLEGLAAVAFEGCREEETVSLLAAAAAIRRHLGAPSSPAERAMTEEIAAAARRELGEERFAARWAEGAALSPDQVISAAHALSPTIRREQASSASGGLQPERRAPARPADPAGLTEREVDVLRLVASGLTNEEIAARLYLSPRTVQSHLRTIYDKLGGTNRAGATRYAHEHKLL